MQLIDGALGLLVSADLDEREAARTACRVVEHDVHPFNVTGAPEEPKCDDSRPSKENEEWIPFRSQAELQEERVKKGSLRREKAEYAARSDERS